MTTVYCIGVFDMLHVGHFNLLYRCKNLTSDAKLIVGVCSDELVKQTKPLPPVVTESERLNQLAKLDIVSEAIVYTDLDQTQILREKRPALFVVPPDYGYSEAHKRSIETAESLQIEIVRLPRTDNISTTLLRFNNLSCANIACDYHDTITYNPEFFKFLFSEWKHGKKYIISGDTHTEEIAAGLSALGITPSMYDEILVTPYPSYGMDNSGHFDIVKDLKLKHIQEKQISIYFDDNPIYAEYLRNYVTVFNTFLSDSYIHRFNAMPKHANINFQTHVAGFIRQAHDSWIVPTTQQRDISDENINVAQAFWKSQVSYPEYGNIKQRRFHEVNYFLKKVGFAPVHTLVDLGCGDGSFVKCIDTLLEIDKVYCFDISEPLLANIPASTRITKQVFDCTDPRYYSTLPGGDILMFGGVINFIFNDEHATNLIRNFKAKHIFIRAVCTMNDHDELVNTYSEKLKHQYASFYRTVESTRRLIEAAGFTVTEHVRIYPDEIESVYSTRQYMFYIDNTPQ